MKTKRISAISVLVLVVVVGLPAGVANADFTFGQRVSLGPIVNSPYGDWDPFIAPDGLSLYFGSTRPGGLGQSDIWMTTKQTSERNPEGYWGPPVNLGEPVNSEYREGLPTVTADGLTLAFSSERSGGLGGFDIWMTTRPTKESPWGPLTNLGSPINSEGSDLCGCISSDGCSLYFSTGLSIGDDGFNYGGDVYVTRRPTRDSPWEPPINLGLIASHGGSGNWDPSISGDGLALFFDSDYADVSLLPDIWLATRTRNSSEWGTPVLLGPEINTQYGEQKPSISADGSTLYWGSGGAIYDTWDLWQSAVSPVVDLNADGIVDAADMCIVVDNWGTDNSLCDIGPMPWGDGIVDVEDLIVLAEHLFEEVRLAQ
jgi:Tol biopolymer transport system component